MRVGNRLINIIRPSLKSLTLAKGHLTVISCLNQYTMNITYGLKHFKSDVSFRA